MVRANLAIKLTYDESDIKTLEDAIKVLDEVATETSKCGIGCWAERTKEAKDIIKDLLEGFVW